MALPAISATALFGLAMLVVGAVICLVSGRHVWRMTSLVRAEAVDRLDGVDAGALVRVSGTVRATGQTLTAPFSGVDCVALRSVVEERRLGEFLFPTYVTVRESTQSVGFEVQTPHAAVSVADPARTVALDSTTVATVALGDGPPDRIERYERETVAARAARWSFPGPLAAVARALSLGARRYSEHRASPGDEVTVVGRVTSEHLDPLVVSTASPVGTLRRLSRTSLAGLLIGVGALALGAGLLVLA